MKLIDAYGGLHTMTTPSLSGLSGQSQLLLSHAIECKRKCLSVQSAMDELSKQPAVGGNFPTIVGRRPALATSKPSPSRVQETISGSSTK